MPKAWVCSPTPLSERAAYARFLNLSGSQYLHLLNGLIIDDERVQSLNATLMQIMLITAWHLARKWDPPR